MRAPNHNSSLVKASESFKASYGAEKNAYFRGKGPNASCSILDWKRRNYFSIMGAEIQTMQLDSSDPEVFEAAVRAKIQEFTNNEQRTNFILQHGGQVLASNQFGQILKDSQQGFGKHFAFLGSHLDISLFFWSGSELKHITFTLQYGIKLFKGPLTDLSFQDYILDPDSGSLIQLSESQAEILDQTLGKITEDLHTHFGKRIHSSQEQLEQQPPSLERLAGLIAIHLNNPDGKEETEVVASLVTLLEENVSLALTEGLSLRRQEIKTALATQPCPMSAHPRDEASLVERLKAIDGLLSQNNFKPYITAVDLIKIEKNWSPPEVKYASTQLEHVEVFGKWLKSKERQEGDLLFLYVPGIGSGLWIAYEKLDGDNYRTKVIEGGSAFFGLLKDVDGERKANGYDYSKLSALLEKESLFEDGKVHQQASPVLQRELAYHINFPMHSGTLLGQEVEVWAKTLQKKASVPLLWAENRIELHQREEVVRRVFAIMRKRETHKESGYIRDKLPSDHLDELENFLLNHLVNDPACSGLSDVEFLQLSSFAVEDFAKMAEDDGSKIPLKFKADQKNSYYKSSFLPRIREERLKIVSNRGSLLRNLKKLKLTSEKMDEFSKGLVDFVSDLFSKGGISFFVDENNALQALCADIFRGDLDGENDIDIDELLYRLIYLQKENKIDGATRFIQILLEEVVHLKMIREKGWLNILADQYRKAKAPIYTELSKAILAEVEGLISRNEMAQNNERQEAFRACWKIVEKGNELMEKSPESTEDFEAGKIMAHLGVKLINPWNSHYKSHHVCLSKTGYIPKNRDKLINEVEGIIEKEISSKQELTQYDNLGERIRIYIQNIFITVFSAGIAPLVRKYALNKSAFFHPPREEIIENVPQQLRAVKSG